MIEFMKINSCKCRDSPTFNQNNPRMQNEKYPIIASRTNGSVESVEDGDICSGDDVIIVQISSAAR